MIAWLPLLSCSWPTNDMCRKSSDHHRTHVFTHTLGHTNTQLTFKTHTQISTTSPTIFILPTRHFVTRIEFEFTPK